MTEKEKRQQRAKAEDAAFNKMLCWVVFAVIAEAVVLLVKRYYIDVPATDFGLAAAVGLGWFFAVYTWLGLVLTAAGIAWCVSLARNKKSLRGPLIGTVVVGFLWILTLAARFLKDGGIAVMTVVPVAVALLSLIYFLYQRAFFANAIVAGCGLIALWVMRRYHYLHPTAITVGFVIGWLLLAAAVIVSVKVKNSDGKLGKYRLVGDKKCYPVFWVTCAVVLLVSVLALVLGTGVAYYLFYVLIAWVFCLAVYFTVKLM